MVISKAIKRHIISYIFLVKYSCKTKEIFTQIIFLILSSKIDINFGSEEEFVERHRIANSRPKHFITLKAWILLLKV